MKTKIKEKISKVPFNLTGILSVVISDYGYLNNYANKPFELAEK